MKPSTLLRVASVLTLLLTVGHTSGGISLWSPEGDTEVLRAMRTFHFDIAGVSRTYLDFYLGFGYTVSIYLLGQTVALWQLASMAKTNPIQVRPLIGTFLVASVVSAYLAWRFIFVIPLVSFAVVAICLGFAWLSAGRNA